MLYDKRKPSLKDKILKGVISEEVVVPRKVKINKKKYEKKLGKKKK